MNNIRVKQDYQSCDLKGTKKYKQYKEGLDNMTRVEQQILELAMKVASFIPRDKLEGFLAGYVEDELEIKLNDRLKDFCSQLTKDLTIKE